MEYCDPASFTKKNELYKVNLLAAPQSRRNKDLVSNTEETKEDNLNSRGRGKEINASRLNRLQVKS